MAELSQKRKEFQKRVAAVVQKQKELTDANTSMEKVGAEIAALEATEGELLTKVRAGLSLPPESKPVSLDLGAFLEDPAKVTVALGSKFTGIDDLGDEDKGKLNGLLDKLKADLGTAIQSQFAPLASRMQELQT